MRRLALLSLLLMAVQVRAEDDIPPTMSLFVLRAATGPYLTNKTTSANAADLWARYKVLHNWTQDYMGYSKNWNGDILRRWSIDLGEGRDTRIKYQSQIDVLQAELDKWRVAYGSAPATVEP